MKTTMKLISIVAISSMMLALSAFAGSPGPVHTSKCPQKNYVRADGAYSQPLEKIHSAYLKKPSAAPAYSAGWGYIVNDHFRGDLTAIYRGHYQYSADRKGVSEKQKIDSTGVMLSMYYDIKKFDRFTPYVMAGIGSMFNELRELRTPTRIYDGNWRRSFAWQVGLGSKCNIIDNWDADLMYKYVSLGKTNDGTASSSGTQLHKEPRISGSLKTHELSLGVIYKFN